MAYFHINDPNQNEVYKICPDNELFIAGLNPDQSLVHQQPSFLQRDNGLVVGIDQRFTRFYVIDKSKHIVKKLHIEWSECKVNSNQSLINESFEYDRLSIVLVGIGLIFVLATLIWLKRGKTCK